MPAISLLVHHPGKMFMWLAFFEFQVQWGGRWQDEAGATTGEEVEQINSHFSPLGNSTKHMLPEGNILVYFSGIPLKLYCTTYSI